MTADPFLEFEDEAPARPVWLMTLADLSLLLVGFFVFLQANQQIGPRDLAAALRAGFTDKPHAMPVELALVGGFAPGSSEFQPSPAALEWAREAARDPRTRLRIAGEVDGSPEDVDALTGSGAILAADRARAVAAWLVRSGAATPGRIAISTGVDQRRVVLTSGYDGGRQ
ncbi:flagellar motor protein MotB [Sphingomonas sp. AOB5]|uniref:flagellar motor protein MotB n=1 Tax=Sphingomonas sp. AOB5 TaxID=3034017 RepID=UPI0023FA233A|nr:flagellar motor protein MotB [Sphingomonas sp. AOB5]MDF7777531.1 flagellar motor protein MotB [Sphingomonas sp. AOB5]